MSNRNLAKALLQQSRLSKKVPLIWPFVEQAIERRIDNGYGADAAEHAALIFARVQCNDRYLTIEDELIALEFGKDVTRFRLTTRRWS